MGEIQWTSDQRTIIGLRDANILVSAAAGSGKTAVLVERIFQRIMDKENPVDVDQFVIVTFTHAAAAQMKDRLRERIEKALEADPDNRHLQRQTGLIASAHISTVHSFCGYVIQNYFHRIGIDPSYRQGTKSELALLQKEVLENILEDEYTKQQEDFVELAKMNMFNRSDEGMEEMILSIYNKAMSEPFPLKWLEQMEEFFRITDAVEWEQSEIAAFLMEDCRKRVVGIAEEAARLQSLCENPAGPYMYEANVKEVSEICEMLLRANTYGEYHQILSLMKWKRMSSKKDETVDAAMRQEVKDRRNRCKDLLTEMREMYFFQSIEEHVADLTVMGGRILTLIRLTKQFMEGYTEVKRERNVVDFNDLEQLALSILLPWDEDKKEHVRSAAARELSEHFEEIMIDEYQDSNRVQDTLLASVSRKGVPGRMPNIFMVGDVKQSIYRFRNACPELFAEKLETYGTKEGDLCRRIDLHQNFRSREVVLEGSNCVFETVMHRDIGGVEYDADARLQTGRCFEKTEKRVAEKIDTYVIQGDGDAELEGRLAALKIREMMRPEEPLYIQDGDTLRPVCFRDIVILTRSVKDVGQSYFDALTEDGIPVVMEHSQGFFDTREIQLMAEMLQVIDNPRMDMPLAGVLCGPMFCFTEEELARIRSKNKKVDLYESLLLYIDEPLTDSSEDEALLQKIQDFLFTLERMRKKTTYAPVAELIQDIYDETGIYEAVQMMRDGAQRAANMDSLMEQAREFDGTTYHGLHQFVRYIQRIREQQEEMGEVNIVGEEEDVVRIMTIHKSKGLEFPVCILVGMGRKFGGRKSPFLTIQPELGIASKLIDNDTRTVKDTIYRNILKRQNDMADLGEEMRVLYVAMTRAQEKLILIGCAKEICAGEMNYLGRSRIQCYLDMVLPAALREEQWFNVIPVLREDLVEETAARLIQDTMETEALYNFDTSIRYHEKTHEYLERLEQQEELTDEPLPVKVSVSDLKVKSMEEMEMQDFTILTHEEEEDEMPVPAFMQSGRAEETAHQGAAYGTIWHQVMATIDFTRTGSEEEIRDSVAELVRTGRLRQEETSVLNYRRLHVFFQSTLGLAMKKAAEEGRLHREQPFVMGEPACELFPDRKEKDTVLVQGIIDGYYETEEGIVLMDYKTDSLKEGEEELLISRYNMQMKLYKKALENMMDCPVKECILYSFSLGREIVCPCD